LKILREKKGRGQIKRVGGAEQINPTTSVKPWSTIRSQGSSGGAGSPQP